MRRDMEHLLARQGHAHRTVELARRQGCQDGVAIDRQLAAEAAADILGDHLDPVGIELQRVGDRLVGALDQLQGADDGELAVLPRGEAGVRLHHGVRLIRRLVDRIEFYRRRSERLVEIAELAVGRRAGRTLAGVVGSTACRFENEDALGLLIGDDQGRSGGTGCFRRFRYHERDRLAEVLDLVAGELRLGPGVAVVGLGLERRLLGCVLVRHHQQHTRHAPRGVGIDACHASTGDGCPHDGAERHAVGAVVGGIGRRARHLGASVDAVDGLADHLRHVSLPSPGRRACAPPGARPAGP